MRKTSVRLRSLVWLAALGVVFLCASTSHAQFVIDLTTSGAKVTSGDAVFEQIVMQPTGTGNIQSFVRISSNANFEFGYNTSGRPLQYDENNSPNFTRDLQLSAIPIVNIGGTDYRQFLLDINQTGTNPLLNLNSIQIFQTAKTGLLGSTGVDGTGQGTLSFGADANLIYNLDAAATGDQTVLMDYSLNTGSGSGDIFLYVKASLFDPNIANVILYSQFGTPPGPNNNNDGYEEWAVLKTPNTTELVPAPAGLLPAVIGLFGCLGYVKLRRRKAVQLA